jgi:hypothetical protein
MLVTLIFTVLSSLGVTATILTLWEAIQDKEACRRHNVSQETWWTACHALHEEQLRVFMASALFIGVFAGFFLDDNYFDFVRQFRNFIMCAAAVTVGLKSILDLKHRRRVIAYLLDEYRRRAGAGEAGK